MRSLGRPPARRELERLFWVKIGEGMSSEVAATAVGVSQPVGSRWFRDRGGMSPFDLTPQTGRYLSFAEREEIATLPRQRVLGARDRTPSGACAVDDLSGVAAQRRHARRRAGIPGLGRAVEGRT